MACLLLVAVVFRRSVVCLLVRNLCLVWLRRLRRSALVFRLALCRCLACLLRLRARRPLLVVRRLLSDRDLINNKYNNMLHLHRLCLHRWCVSAQ